jgi:hypothetical protein
MDLFHFLYFSDYKLKQGHGIVEEINYKIN